jgi:hypothetical protein
MCDSWRDPKTIMASQHAASLIFYEQLVLLGVGEMLMARHHVLRRLGTMQFRVQRGAYLRAG